MLMGGAVVVLDTQSDHWLHLLVLPACMALGAVLITRAYLAVGLAVSIISWSAVIHPSSTSPYSPVILAISIIATSICVYLLSVRFRTHIKTTHNQRWASKQSLKQNSSEHKAND